MENIKAKTDEILCAALECFSEYGYSKTTMSDIGSRVGMNKASLYYHYKDKLSLYRAVLGKLRAEHKKTVKSAIKECAGIEDEIITFLDCEIDFWANLAISQHFTLESNACENRQLFEEILAKEAKSLKKLLERGVKNKALKSLNATATASSILEIAQGLLTINCPLNLPLSERRAGYNDVKKKIEAVIRVFIRGLM